MKILIFNIFSLFLFKNCLNKLLYFNYFSHEYFFEDALENVEYKMHMNIYKTHYILKGETFYLKKCVYMSKTTKVW